MVEAMQVEELGDWLKDHGFGDDIQQAFKEQYMDGEALLAAFGTHPGPDCLRDVLPKFGQRIKVYNSLKGALREAIGLQDQVSPFGDRSPLMFPEEGCGSDYLYPSAETASQSSQGTKACSSATLSPVPSSSGHLPRTQSNQQGSRKRSALNSPHSPLSPVSPPTTSTTPSRKGANIPNPFPIPQFKEVTQGHLDMKTFDSSDRTYIVRTLATILLTYISRPSMKDCEKVARSLVLKYAFLKEHESWQQFLYVRCQNTNRKPKGACGVDSAPKAKRVKADALEKYSYPTLTGDPDDETSNERNIAALKEQMSKIKLNHDSIRELLKRTFYRRRLAILDDPSPESVRDITESYPALRKASFVAYEMDLITQTDSIQERFEVEWDRYVRIILRYALSHETPTKDLRHAMRNFVSLEDDDELTEVEYLTCLRVLGAFLTLKTRKKVENPKVDVSHLLMEVVRGTPPTEAIDPNNNFPHIVRFVDSDDDIPSQYFIAVEQSLHMECRNIFIAIFVLMSMHYVFNIEYHPKIRDLFYFLQEYVLGLKDSTRKNSAQYQSFTAAIGCYDK